MSSLLERVYNPDVLTCLANLSNDEVFTPPELANQVLDMLPEEIWSAPTIKILDPCCKSGVFLREAAKRFIEGLEPIYPDLQERVDHIMHEQLFGIAITELTSLLSRRSVYCSKFPNGKFSVSAFDDAEGNIRFRTCQHTWVNGRCKYCGVPQVVYERTSELESYAYEFIHLDNPELELDMKFDVVVGNPPYQMNDGGGNGSSAMPIYQHFITQAKRMKPKHLIMIVPAKWQSGGKGLDAFRASMLQDRRIKEMVTYSDSRDCFNGVDIAGGVSYFHWDRDYQGDCSVTLIENGNSSTSSRPLDEYPIFIASNKALNIIRKVTRVAHEFYSTTVRARKPFGIASGSESNTGDLALRYRGGTTKIDRSAITSGNEMIDKWKVIISKAAAEHAGQSDKNGQRKMLTVIETLPPQTVCSETYLVVDAFASETEARNLEKYLRTRFVRYLIWQATPTQNISRSCFCFVPKMPLDTDVSDKKLYELFKLDATDIQEIEAKIKMMPEGDQNE